MFIRINGIFPQDPNLLLKEYSRMGWDTSTWFHKANAFHYNRGTTASVGYFLMTKADIGILSASITIEVNTSYTLPGKKPSQSSGNQINISGLRVADIECINPQENPDKGIYLVKIIDPIVNRWSHTYVDLDFNIPIGIEKEELSPSNIITKTVYDKSTINTVGTNRPYTWKDIFKFTANNTINISKASFAKGKSDSEEITPEGFKFKNNTDGTPMTRKQALDILLRVTGYTIVRKPDEVLELVPIDTSGVEEQLAVFRRQFLRFDSHIKKSRESIKIPEKINFRFPRIDLQDTLDVKYSRKVKSLGQLTSSQLPVISGLDWLINAPLYDNGDNAEDQDEVAKHLLKIYETAFQGLSPELQELELHTYINLTPDKGISKVIYFFTGDAGPRTFISSDPGITFPQSPDVIPHEIIAKGSVINLDPQTSIFNVSVVDLISGNLDYITGGGQKIKDVHKLFPNQTLTNGDKVIVFYNQSTGQYEAFLPGEGGGGQGVKQFGMLEDMNLGDGQKFAATILNDLSLDFQTPEQRDADGDRRFYVLDNYFNHVGKARVKDTDTFSSDDREYRGFAQKVSNDWQGSGFPAYDILYMEHPARFLVVELVESHRRSTGTVGGDARDDTSCRLLQSTITPDHVQVLGRPEQGRKPQTTEGGETPPDTGGAGGDEPFDLKVYDNQMQAASKSYAKKGEIWYVVYIDDLDHYEFFKPVLEAFILIKGTVVKNVTAQDATFRVENFIAIQGANPAGDPDTEDNTGTLLVKNSPAEIRQKGNEVTLSFDRTLSEILHEQWKISGRVTKFLEVFLEPPSPTTP